MPQEKCKVCGKPVPAGAQWMGNCSKFCYDRSVIESIAGPDPSKFCVVCGILITEQGIEDGDVTCHNPECIRTYDPLSFRPAGVAFKIDAGDKGLRYNSDKTRWSLIPSEVISELADHYTRGAKKYFDENWRNGLSFNDTYDCAMRHIHAWKMGEERDEETGSRHLIAAIWNLVALVYFSMYPTRYGKFDDRYPNEAHAWHEEETSYSIKPENDPYGEIRTALKFAEEYPKTQATELAHRLLKFDGPNRRIRIRRLKITTLVLKEKRTGKGRRVEDK